MILKRWHALVRPFALCQFSRAAGFWEVLQCSVIKEGWFASKVWVVNSGLTAGFTCGGAAATLTAHDPAGASVRVEANVRPAPPTNPTLRDPLPMKANRADPPLHNPLPNGMSYQQVSPPTSRTARLGQPWLPTARVKVFLGRPGVWLR